MIYEGQRGSFSESKWIKNRFQIELTMHYAPRCPRDAPRQLQDAQRRSQDTPRHPKTAPRRSQDAPRIPFDGPKTTACGAKNLTKTQLKWQTPPDRDFGGSWGRFWKVLESNLGDVEVDFPRNLREICGALGRLSIQDRQRTTSKTTAKR